MCVCVSRRVAHLFFSLILRPSRPVTLLCPHLDANNVELLLDQRVSSGPLMNGKTFLPLFLASMTPSLGFLASRPAGLHDGCRHRRPTDRSIGPLLCLSIWQTYLPISLSSSISRNENGVLLSTDPINGIVPLRPHLLVAERSNKKRNDGFFLGGRLLIPSFYAILVATIWKPFRDNHSHRFSHVQPTGWYTETILQTIALRRSVSTFSLE